MLTKKKNKNKSFKLEERRFLAAIDDLNKQETEAIKYEQQRYTRRKKALKPPTTENSPN